MPLLRHAATPLPLASTIQQHLLPSQQCIHLYHACSRPQFPYALQERQQWPRHQHQHQHQHQLFHTTPRLRDEQIDRAQNHYETLKLEPGATPAEVKKSFYTLSKRHHPDVHAATDRPAASRRFMRISEAYAVLSIPAKRRAYDRDTLRLDHHSHHRHRHPPPSGGSYHSTNVHNQAGGRPASGLSRRRGTFQGPPPSFFRSGGWGGHGAKRRAAHEESAGAGGGNAASGYASNGNASAGATGPGAGTMGGMGPGQDPFKSAGDRIPHFDRTGHERMGRHVDARRAARQGQGYGQGQGLGQDVPRDQHGRKIAPAVEPERGTGALFLIIGGVLLFSILGPFAIGRLFGIGGGGGSNGERTRRKPTAAAAAPAKRGAALDR